MVISAVDNTRAPPSSLPPKVDKVEASVVVPASDGGQQNARYFSPYVQFDRELGLALIQYRDAETGAVIRQVPSKQAIDEYRARSSERETLGPANAGRTRTGSQVGAGADPAPASDVGSDQIGSLSLGISATRPSPDKAAEQPVGGGERSGSA